MQIKKITIEKLNGVKGSLIYIFFKPTK